MISPLPPERLHTPCPTDPFEFETTTELEPLDEIIGQDRAVDAIRFGIDVRAKGYNIFAFGPPGTGKRTTIELFLQRAAKQLPEPDDWCYVHNFEVPHRPHALRLPTGWGSRLQPAMDAAIEELRALLPERFESEEFHARRARTLQRFEEQKRERFDALTSELEEEGLTVVRREEGLGIAPADDEGEVLDPEKFHALPEERKAELRAAMSGGEEQLDAVMREARRIDRQARRAVEELHRQAAAEEVSERLEGIRADFADIAAVIEWLDAVSDDILDHIELFLPGEDQESEQAASNVRAATRRDVRLRRYGVNVLVEGSGQAGAPLIVETHPTLPNLVGRIEHEQRFGALITDFTLIKAGALHRANGGFLVLEMDEVAQHPSSWDALKRALKTATVPIEPPADPGNTMTTVRLDPEPIPLDCKVLLIGDPEHYFLLHERDPDFAELFKVGAEFTSEMDRFPDGCHLYARFVRTVSEREGTRPFDGAAVARLVEHGARLADDAQKLTVEFLAITDVIRESHYWCGKEERDVVTRSDVEAALKAAEARADLARERIYEEFERSVLQVDTDGKRRGQLNALTVVSRGDFAFGMPIRVTASVRQGSGTVIDIEREVELGGPLHSKGVLILSGYISGRYLPLEPPSVEASLTFEQSYGPVDGDSASSAELYALISALSEIELRQGIAVTGAVSQTGEVQAIGGVNEKIEGFFDICEQDGLTGTQGVIIPASNVDHLMLRADVIEAARDGAFHIYPVEHVDEGLEILMEMDAGEREEDDRFPEGTINYEVERRLQRFVASRKDDDGD